MLFKACQDVIILQKSAKLWSALSLHIHLDTASIISKWAIPSVQL